MLRTLRVTSVNQKLLSRVILATQDERIHLKIDSSGGDALCGINSYLLLKTSGKVITTEVYSNAGSAASILFLSGEKRYARVNSKILIHNSYIPFVFNLGRRESRMCYREMLSIDKFMVSVYLKNSHLKEREIKSMMDREVTFSSTEGEKLGFVTQIFKP
jgi:ATP-dependent Clp protease, protease subunit